jgi:hypothetical protein
MTGDGMVAKCDVVMMRQNRKTAGRAGLLKTVDISYITNLCLKWYRKSAKINLLIQY